MRHFDPDVWFDYKTYGKSEAEYKATLEVNEAVDSCNKEWLFNAEENKIFYDKIIPRNMFDGDNVIVVGAGPSHKVNLGVIKQAQEQGAKIVCVDRAHPNLKLYGITPDLTVACDHRAIIGDFLRHTDKKDTVAMDVNTNPRVCRKQERKAGKFYIFCLCNPYSNVLVEFYKVYPKEIFFARPGFVVGFNATDIAFWSGAKSIALVGNELSWPDDIDKIESIYSKNKETQFVKVIKNSTKESKLTTPAFMAAAGVFKVYNDLHTNSGCKFYECSDGLIDAFEQKSLLEVTRSWQTNI